jgi:hypothetical protein
VICSLGPKEQGVSRVATRARPGMLGESRPHPNPPPRAKPRNGGCRRESRLFLSPPLRVLTRGGRKLTPS